VAFLHLFALVQAMVTVSARGESDSQALAKKIRERVAAHAVSIEGGELASVSFLEIVNSVLSAYEGRNLSLASNLTDVQIPRRAVTPIGLVLHELATNA